MSKKTGIYACKYAGVPASKEIDAHTIRFNLKNGAYVDVQISKSGSAVEITCDGRMVVLPNVANQITVQVKQF